MTDTTKTLIDLIANKLALQYKAVKKWVKSNDYSVDQLLFLSKQISSNEISINKLSLLLSIIQSIEYLFINFQRK